MHCLINIIHLMSNIFTIVVQTILNLYTIYHYTPLRCQIAKRILNEHRLKMKHRAWLNQPPIQFSGHLESPIKNLYSDTSFSHVGDEDNDIEVGMDDFL